jgi:hypothetical protein
MEQARVVGDFDFGIARGLVVFWRGPSVFRLE